MILARALCVSFGLALACPAAAQDYPTRLIKLITPAAQGGTTDILARLFGAKFIEWTKNFKGPLNFGSAGIGGGGHEEFRRFMSADLVKWAKVVKERGAKMN